KNYSRVFHARNGIFTFAPATVTNPGTGNHLIADKSGSAHQILNKFLMISLRLLNNWYYFCNVQQKKNNQFMKHRILLLAAVTTVGFAACNSNQEGEYTQEQLDSIVQARADSTANALKLENDSVINAMADSLAAHDIETPVADAAGVNKGSSNSGTSSKPAKEEAPAEEPAKEGGLRGKSDQSKQESNSGGLRSRSDQAKQDQAAEKPNGGGLRSRSDQAKSGDQ